MPRLPRLLIFFLILLPFSPTYALTSDQLLLITNHNNPDSRKLAEHYAKVRHVPDGRILELPLPVGDEISFEQYERDVVPAVKQFLTDNNLQQKVTCLVTFYGMPLRIARRPAPGDDEKKELAFLQSEITKTHAQIEPIVLDFEKMAQKLDPSFDPHLSIGSSDAAQRADRAAHVITEKIATMTDPALRDQTYKAMIKIMEQLAGPDSVALYTAQHELQTNPNMPQAEHNRWTAMIQFVDKARTELKQFFAARYDPASRAQARKIAQEQFGLIEYTTIIQQQLEYLRPGDTASAFDSELSLLWYDSYPRAAWLPNPLYYTSARLPHPTALMVSRIDAPDLATAERMIVDSLKAEKTGLTGRIVVDTRGIASTNNAFGKFDQHLLNFASLVKAHPAPGMDLYLDTKEAVLPANSVENVALYAGWYSVGHYIPCCKFVPGGVAYHIASFELVSLHTVGGYWVPHLLKDAGAAASFGAVAEPYLHSFPLPDEFFPLLMTGKLTLAECFWRTNPLASWMIALVGDPLYNPFVNRPALLTTDLPVNLQAAFQDPVNQMPTTQP